MSANGSLVTHGWDKLNPFNGDVLDKGIAIGELMQFIDFNEGLN